MAWQERWFSLCELVASWSKDDSKKVGAVIVDDDNRVISLGWNGFPRGINDGVQDRKERPVKYKWTEHAERNAIYNSSANGHSLKNCSIYVTMFPCADCARAIIQSGIKKVYTPEPDLNHERWGEDFAISLQMFEESGVEFYSLG